MKIYEYKRKVVCLNVAVKLVEKLKIQKNSIVFTNGCFDILHRGHVDYLRKSRAMGDFLIVGLNSDRSIKKLKGDNRPINSQADRAFVLEALEFVDLIIIFEEDTPIELINKLKPNIYTKGGDYDLSNIIGEGLGAEIVENYGGRVCLVPIINNISSTKIIGKLNE